MSYIALFTEVQSQLSELGVVDMDRVINAPVCLDLPYVAACSLSASLTKKLVPTDKKKLRHLESVAITTFLSMNERCKTQVIADSPLIREMRWIIERDLQPFTFEELLNEYPEAIGPGASVGSRECNSLYEKLFINDLTVTRPSMYNLYYANLDPTRQQAELFRLAKRAGKPFKLSPGSVLTTVAKNNRTNRTICTEPSLNMYFQQCIGNYMNRLLKQHCGYDKALQPNRNKLLAKRGSLEGDIATIDLTSASDTISMRLMESIFPVWFVDCLKYVRSPATRISGRWVQLHMLSSMGNGFTFPMQTYIFSTVLRAICRLNNRSFKRFNEADTTFGVFGDDIVCPSSLFTQVCSALEEIGAIPNREKSFATGFFRESCGGDYYNGHDIRGVYVKNLTNLSDFCSSLNRLSRFISKHGLPISLSRSYLFAISRSAPFVPPCVADTEGLKVPESFAKHLRRKNGYRYVSLLQKSRKAVLCYETLDPDGNLSDIIADNPVGMMVYAATFGLLTKVERRVNASQRDKFIRGRKFTPFWACSNPVWDFAGNKVHFSVVPSTFALKSWLDYVERQILG